MDVFVLASGYHRKYALKPTMVRNTQNVPTRDSWGAIPLG